MPSSLTPSDVQLRFGENVYALELRALRTERNHATWWVAIDDAWFEIGATSSGDVAEEARAWLAGNVVHPNDDPSNEECGPAWTATHVSPIVVEHRGTVYYCWPDQPTKGETDDDDVTRWFVRSPTGDHVGPVVDCDDTVYAVLQIIRTLPA